MIQEKPRGSFLGEVFFIRKLPEALALQGLVHVFQICITKTRSKENITVVARHQHGAFGGQSLDRIFPDHSQGIPYAIIHFSTGCRTVHEAQVRESMPEKNRSRLLWNMLKFVRFLKKIVTYAVIF